MDIQSIRQRNRYNREFYTTHGVSFAKKREYFWPSWWEFVRASSVVSSHRSVRITDVGCGSARLAAFWQEQVAVLPEQYVGLDISPTLLAVAQHTLSALQIPFALYQTDIVEELLSDTFSLPHETNIVALFGVLHHIPDQYLRQKLLQALIDALPPSGELWLTLWNPARFDVKAPQQTRVLTEDLNEEQTEVGADVVLGWQDDPTAERFVHWITENEETELLKALSHAEVVKRWNQNSRGERGNICLLLKKELA